ncbi:Ldh family oxidoreductase [Chloroflexota bacterium]
MINERVLIDARVIKGFLAETFARAGLSANDSAMMTEVLLEAELKGIETHGVRLAPIFLRGLASGQVNPHPEIKVIKESSRHAVFDGDYGLGQLVSIKAMNTCIAKAKKEGMALVSAIKSTAFGAARYYSMMALKEGLIGFCTTNTPTVIPVPGVSVATMGNNPLSFAFPSREEYPVVFDMACSVVARGKLRYAMEAGQKIPPQWGLDEKGRPTDDPKIALESWLQPAVGGIKGYGLALMVEILTAVLNGRPSARDLAHTNPPRDVTHLFAALDPELFIGQEEFKIGLDRLIRQIKDSVNERETAYLPEEREFAEKEKRLREGIPLRTATIELLKTAGRELGVETRLIL